MKKLPIQNTILIQMFINFLKEHNMLMPFIINLSNSKKFKNPTLFKYLKTNIQFNWLYFAFNWEVTSEGKKSWLKIHQMWIVYLNHISLPLNPPIKTPTPSKSNWGKDETLFINYLKKYNLLIPFIIKLSQWHEIPLFEYLSKIPKEKWLLNCFMWDSLYWRNRHHAWVIYLQKH